MPRVTAWGILRSGSTTPLREVDRFAARRRLDARDRALVRRIVGTEVRRRATLRVLTRRYVRGRLKPDLLAHVHVGLVQLLFLDRVPDHATIQATSAAAGETHGPSKVRVVADALVALRRARREGESGDPRRDLPLRPISFVDPVFHDPGEHPLLWAEEALSIPAPLYKRWSRRHGPQRAAALARTFLEEPSLALRAVGVEREALAAELEGEGVPTRPGAHARVLVAPADQTAAVTATAAFREGRATVQGESALAAAELLRAEAGERLLDLCAAPGGKTAVLAESGATVVACDVDPRRLARVAEGLERLRPRGPVRLVAGDGAAGLLPQASFDGVLVDAPCSNTGVLGARPGARWRFGPKALMELEQLQERLLAAGASRVRPGGRLVWSTCSLEPEENERRVRVFLDVHPDWRLEEERAALPGSSDEAEPGPIDGGYAARLRRLD